MARLTALFDEVAENPEDRVLVITGAGDGFCSGADLGDSANDSGRGPAAALAGMRIVGRAALRLHELAKPTIAAVNGVAAGAGCNLALGCDLIVASDRARFSEIFSKRGLVVDFGGSWLLPRLVGMHRAKELVLLADIIDARSRTHRPRESRRTARHPRRRDARAGAAVGATAAVGPRTLSKRLLDQAPSMSMAEAIESENAAQALVATSRDTAEAVLAFLEGREPHYTGE